MRVLLTNNSFRSYQGSELVALELAEYFVARGDDVVLYTNFAGPPISFETGPLARTGRFALVADPDADLDPSFDLIWMHHQLLPPAVIEALGRGLRTRVVSHHMSALVEIEFPLFAPLERRLADRILAVSPEVTPLLQEYGITGRVDLFPNPAPASFFDFAGRKRPIDRAASLLVVSNHPPAEVSEAMILLRASGVRAEHIGEGTGPQRITAKLLDGYDAVLTIGKTVQYALPQGLPVYEYDHFGGAGWLSADNFSGEAAHNFSGRATREHKTAQQIHDEVLSGYPAALNFAGHSPVTSDGAYHLPSAVEHLLASLPKHPRRKRVSRAEWARFAAFGRLQRGLHVAATLYSDSLRAADKD
jgi:hypothetical protein